MNYTYPIPQQQSNQAYFVADNTHELGQFTGGLNTRTQITVDYSQLTPAISLNGVSFRITPGGMPELTIGSWAIGGTNSNLLTFFVSDGIGSVAYTVTINVFLATGEARTDTLIVNIFDDNSNGQCCSISPVSSGQAPPANIAMVGGSKVITNIAPRYFVSASAPTNANILDRWYNPVTQVFYDYVTDGLASWWQVS
jgi:hypothetical protein